MLFIVCQEVTFIANSDLFLGFVRNQIVTGRKSHVTVAVSLIFIILAFSGYALLGVDGAGSGLGMWHYRIGLLSSVLFSGHIIRRIPVLRKNTKGKRV